MNRYSITPSQSLKATFDRAKVINFPQFFQRSLKEGDGLWI